MRNASYKLALITGASVLLLGGTVFAFRGSDDSTSTSHNVAQTTEVEHATETENTTTEHSTGDDTSTRSQARVAAAKAHLDAVKLKVCQKRQDHINKRMKNVANHGQRLIDVFTKIAERTEAFYTSKGKTLSNYDALVADVNAKKTAADTAVADIKAKSVTFKCDGTDPKGSIQEFKDSLASEHAAIKAYKTAVKNLIVGVKSVQDEGSAE
jgi:hypothetical protein